jgi:5-methylcytosine-specific restriction endonuclease McrA
MHQTKKHLIQINGTKCMLCRKNVGKRITWHHIIPRCEGGDNSYENGALLCEKCHFEIVNELMYGTQEYEELMQQIRKNKK